MCVGDQYLENSNISQDVYRQLVELKKNPAVCNALHPLHPLHPRAFWPWRSPIDRSCVVWYVTDSWLSFWPLSAVRVAASHYNHY